MMQLTIESKAQQFIVTKGGVIHIYTTPVSGCCGGQMSVDLSGQVKLGLPHERDLPLFVRQEIDGVTVYIHRYLLKDPKDREICLKKILFLEQLIIE